MSNNLLMTVAEVSALIEQDHVLLLAGAEALLAQLPPGRWIGGTAAYFMTQEGGLECTDRIFVTDINNLAETAQVRAYSATDLRDIGHHYPAHGFTVLIVPGLSGILESFAREVQTYQDVFNSPLFGWIAGVEVEQIGKQTPKTFSGSGDGHRDRAVALHVSLPAAKLCRLDIINLFEQGTGATIAFTADGFETKDNDCLIDGKPGNLAAYINAAGIDVKLPLVADYNGAMINVSIRSVDDMKMSVDFFAPVFEGIQYRFANPVEDYIQSFGQQLAGMKDAPVTLSCNCILNYLYAELEGKQTGGIVGPITFGEIAYMLLNQTLVYLSVTDA
ncbi:MAG TPA: hypothetical protein VL752_13400 [Acidisoma sp.]|uniref:DUF6976 family protein n=1 Tax=Acidisoma sp. TaxID=1872115 RepID=UPI002BFFCA06|nr:hypothetical protein [Acidisoma sp.]HTI01936.1 hypothetical protein [Acidisoma sp.]